MLKYLSIVALVFAVLVVIGIGTYFIVSIGCMLGEFCAFLERKYGTVGKISAILLLLMLLSLAFAFPLTVLLQ